MYKSRIKRLEERVDALEKKSILPEIEVEGHGINIGDIDFGKKEAKQEKEVDSHKIAKALADSLDVCVF